MAERYAAVETFASGRPGEMHPVVKDIIMSGRKPSAVDAFAGFYTLAELTRLAASTWQNIDVMVLPTIPTLYKVEQMLADPVRLNSNLGYYTNFVNLMDLSAIAIPSGVRSNGLPFGITLIGQTFKDGAIASLGAAFARASGISHSDPRLPDKPSSMVTIAVVGAHLRGQPLNHQLLDRHAEFKGTRRTGRGYALHALHGTKPSKPGLIRDEHAHGLIEVELWALSPEAFGSFVNEIPSPLGIGTITLDDGATVKGFLCESHAVNQARDITHFGGWRAYLASLQTDTVD